MCKIHIDILVNLVYLSHKFEGDLISDDGGVSVSNVGKGSGVHEDGRLLHSL